MRILVLTGSLLPIPGNNANLLLKLLPFLAAENELRILSTVIYDGIKDLPESIHGFPVYWVDKQRTPDYKRRLLFPALSKLKDPNGNSDELNVLYVMEYLPKIQKEFPFDVIISTSEPYPAAVISSRIKCRRILYLMDPPELIRDGNGTQYRNETLRGVLNAQDQILTTPFIRDALMEHGMQMLRERITTVGFPMVEDHSHQTNKRSGNKIRLLFCGWMCSELRSPKYFLDIVSRLDDRFEVTFMGKECELLQERFPTKSKATLITLPNQPYNVALQAMADADVLINIGNSVPVHMPSKTLEYINTGKPMVNFYKFSDCPTLYYTKRYPLALNLFEENDVDDAAEQFVHFCEQSCEKTVDRSFIEAEYRECMPSYVAKKILLGLSN